MTNAEFHSLLTSRWHEIASLGCEGIELPYKIDPDYPHFRKKRGFAVTFYDDKTHTCSLQFAPKLLQQSLSRVDAIVRHELGHVVDFLVPRESLELQLGKLPDGAEIRADVIAERVWRHPIRYDRDLVQTLGRGIPRPRSIGL